MSRASENRDLLRKVEEIYDMEPSSPSAVELLTLMDISKSLAAIADELANIKAEMKKQNRRS